MRAKIDTSFRFVSLAYRTADSQCIFPGYHGGPLGIAHPLNDAQEDLSDQIVATWTNFAWTGNPNGLGNYPWPRYTVKNKQVLSERLNGLTTETDAQFAAQHKCAFWDPLSTTPKN